MPKFQYEAMNQAGQEIRDEVDANSTEEALQDPPARLLPHQDPPEGRQKGRSERRP